jgi:LmbE family N-acetylglucosaminyl deacetylase
MDIPKGKSFLILSPHPDDDIFGVGGTLLKLSDKCLDKSTLYFSLPGNEQDKNNPLKDEALLACTAVNSTPYFLNLPENKFPINPEVVSKLNSIINKTEPDVIFIPFMLDDNEDHRRVNEILYNATKDLKLNCQIWAYQIYSTVVPNVVIDITNTMAEKQKAMEIWKSVKGNRNWPHYIKGMNAANCRYIPGKHKIYAESFFVVPMDEYLKLCQIYFSNNNEELYSNEFYRNM